MRRLTAPDLVAGGLNVISTSLESSFEYCSFDRCETVNERVRERVDILKGEIEINLNTYNGMII